MWAICVCASWPGVGSACDWFGRIVLLLGRVVGEPLGVVWKALGGQEEYEENIIRHLVNISSHSSTSSGNSGTNGVTSGNVTQQWRPQWGEGAEVKKESERKNLFPCHDVFLLTGKHLWVWSHPWSHHLTVNSELQKLYHQVMNDGK